MKKKILCLVLALAMLLSLAACGGNNNPPADQPQDTPTDTPDDTDTPVEPAADGELVPYTYDEDEVYDAALGEFYETYMKAFETNNTSERYALMALAEGKMLGAGVMIPLTTRGGQYVLRKVAPRSGSTIITVYAQTFRNAGSGKHTVAAEFFTNSSRLSTMRTTAQNYYVNIGGGSGSGCHYGGQLWRIRSLQAGL